jgi:thiol-disulfide isomerase/thioredoxin
MGKNKKKIEDEKPKEEKIDRKPRTGAVIFGTLVIGLIAGGFLGFLMGGAGAPEARYDLEYFYSPTCEACIEVSPWIKQFASDNNLSIKSWDATSTEGKALFESYGLEYYPTAVVHSITPYAGASSIQTSMPRYFGISPPKSEAEYGAGGPVKVIYFYGETCPYCDDVYEDAQAILRANKDAITVEYIEVYGTEGAWDKLAGYGSNGVPTIVVNGKALIGTYEIRNNLDIEINSGEGGGGGGD